MTTPRTGTSRLDRAQIGRAALRVLDERGAEEFSIRAVAAALGVSPMALYRHVRNKSELAALVIDTALDEHELPTPTDAEWDQELIALARWVRRTWLAHPEVAHLRAQQRLWWTPSMFPIAERWVNLWQRSGLDLESALTAALASAVVLVGVIEAESRLMELPRPEHPSLRWLPAARALYQLPRDWEALFELVITSTIRGLHAQLTVGRA